MENPVVKIADGELKGTQRINSDGEKFYSFLGIPFAKAPVGELRFKAPEPIEPWTGIKDVTVEGNVCYHRIEFNNELVGSEDCLNLHVFTKKLPSKESKLKPVMVWIYGGAFKTGSNSTQIYGPEFLMNEDIVLVSINYRTGFLGFLKLDDASLEVPGNAGIKDQQLALKWVQKNIKNFNGDPKNVTIFGESAGSASVHLHVLSPSSKGLFHKAILQSGAVLNPWAVCNDSSLRFAKIIDSSLETEKDALETLRKLPVEKLHEFQEKFYEIQAGLRTLGPTVEKPNDTAVQTTNCVDTLASGQYNKVPLLMGYCDREALLLEVYKQFAIRAGKEIDDKYETLGFESFIPPDMNIGKDDPKQLIIKKKIMEFYSQGSNAADKYMLPSDAYFIAGIIASAKIHAKTSTEPVYLYRNSLDAGMNLLKRVCKITQPGVCHADELGYLFNATMAAPYFTKGDIEQVAMKRFVKLWTNFARTGNPTPKGNDLNVEWKPVTDNQINFLDIGTELKPYTDPESERMKIWTEVYGLSSNPSYHI